MSTPRIVLGLFLLLANSVCFSQEFNQEQQYKQAMENAKMALNAQQYSQAVMFYREALSIKANELLPKYKIEDIRTIYIKNEMDSIVITQAPVKKLKKKEQIEHQKQIAEKAEKSATEKMIRQAEDEKKELEKLTKISEVLDINEDIEVHESIQIEDTQSDRYVLENKLDNKTALYVGINKTEPKPNTGLIIEEREVPVVEETKEPIIVQKPEPEKKVIHKPVVKLEKDEEWIKKENGKLVIKYPDKKTVENISKPGKEITRVIMNIDNKVSIYLKVKHSWGATFYFVDEVGFELKSISAIHFNRMTDLATYKKE